jgi:hypothetical protein
MYKWRLKRTYQRIRRQVGVAAAVLSFVWEMQFAHSPSSGTIALACGERKDCD